MRWLNYHHLRYFWAVARHGSIRRTSSVLRVSQPTISEQIHQLEDSLGVQLFLREGRRLRLTERGQMVYRYAESIFTIGEDLLDALEDRPPGHARRYVIGVADVLPKMTAVKLLEPVLSDPTVRLVVQQDVPDRLMALLESHVVDAVLTDAPASPTVAPRAVSHPLGESVMVLLGREELVATRREGFPGSLDRAPLLLPSTHNSIRQALDRWFLQEGIRPDTVGEFSDSAMMMAFGRDGFGIFPALEVVADEVCAMYGVSRLGVAEDVFERFYLVTLEGREDDPAVRAIRGAGRKGLFPQG